MLLSVVVLSVVSFALPAFAEEEQVTGKFSPIDEKSPAQLTPGTIASMGQLRESRDIAVRSGGAAPGDKESPITASVGHASERECQVTVQNTSKDAAYSLTFEVIGSDKNGKLTSQRSFSARVAAGANVTRMVPCGKEENIEVFLKSGKRV